MSMALRINIMELIKLPTQIRAHAQQYKKNNPMLKKSTAKRVCNHRIMVGRPRFNAGKLASSALK